LLNEHQVSDGSKVIYSTVNEAIDSYCEQFDKTDMKNVFKIEISTWTSSFRYPNIISGFQPTLEVPPISTVLGLINAAAGKYLDFNQQEIGYYFEFGAKAIDIETLYQVDKISADKTLPLL
jgi:CRISPR-associated Cas5-like protein